MTLSGSTSIHRYTVYSISDHTLIMYICIMYMCVCVCVCVCVCMYVCVYVCTYMYVCMYNVYLAFCSHIVGGTAARGEVPQPERAQL